MIDQSTISEAVRAGAPDSFPDLQAAPFDAAADRYHEALLWHVSTERRGKRYRVFVRGHAVPLATVVVYQGEPKCQSRRCAGPTSCVHAKAWMIAEVCR